MRCCFSGLYSMMNSQMNYSAASLPVLCTQTGSGVFHFSGWDDGQKLTGFTGNSGLKPSKLILLIDIEILYRAFETDRILNILLSCRNLCERLNNYIKSRFLLPMKIGARKFTRQSLWRVYQPLAGTKYL